MRYIDNVMITFPPRMDHPYAHVLMSPQVDAFPRALTILAHATVESTVRNVAKLLHKTKLPERLDAKWSASKIEHIIDTLNQCDVQPLWGLDMPITMDSALLNISELIERRHAIVHFADLPWSPESQLLISSRSPDWAFSVVMYSAAVIRGAFPELTDAHRGLLRRVVSEWTAGQIEIMRRAGQLPGVGITI